LTELFELRSAHLSSCLELSSLGHNSLLEDDLIQGNKVPRNETSMEQIIRGTFVPRNE